MNAMLLVATAGIGITLWGQGHVSAGVVATALPLAWQIANVAGWVSWEVTGIFENIGVVQEGMETIAVPHALVDRPGARELAVPHGEIRFEHLTFTYGRTDGRRVLDDLNLVVRPGERVGLVGRSGAGKSTLVNLLLRFHELEQGSIRIDGQDIRDVTQESLRAAIGMVTQDTSLLHRSIAANIGYGRPGASFAEIESAARRAQAHDFIVDLQDWKGRTGYDAHVGERGVKLSGGQRQRIAIARVDAQERADPRARRGDVRARQRGRARDPGAAAGPHGRQDGDRDRAPPVDDRAHGPADRARARPHRRGRHARRAAARATATTRCCGGTSRAASCPHDLPVEDAPVVDDGPVDDMRAEEQPEPSTNDEPMPTRTS